MTSDLTREELDAAVERIAQETLWEAGIETPAVDAILAAHRLGCVVAAKRPGGGRASRVSLAGPRKWRSDLILLDGDDRPERRQWAVAHELGERAAHRVFDRLGISPLEAPGDAREQIANRFASCLLLPARWMLPHAADCDWDLTALKREFSTASHELIARRVLDLHGAPICVTVVDQGKQTWRRGNRSRPPAPCPTEIETWMHAHQHNQAAQHYPQTEGVARVRTWPVHEPDWLREIVLTEFEE